MNIDDLTLGQLKEIARMFPQQSSQQVNATEQKPDILAHLVGRKVLIRDNGAGLILTTLVEIRGKEWLGGKSRKIHYWEKAGAVEGIAETGIDLNKSRITVTTAMSAGKDLVQICPVGDEIYRQIMEATPWNPK